MLSNNEIKVIKAIESTITNDNKLSKLFSHHRQKYTINELLTNVFIVLKNGLSFREISIYTKIYWNTVYKFFIKLTKHKIINEIYSNTINKYLIEINKNSYQNKKYLFTDTTIIQNKLGVDKVSINPQLKKHKSSKISIVIDDFGVPINSDIFLSSINDAKIADLQINNIIKLHPLMCTNNNILIGDAAYDSNNIRKLLTDFKIGVLLTPKNIRNTKNTEKIKSNQLSLEQKLLLNKRILVEHTINRYKQFKRLNNRYDKKSENFKTFLFIASLIIVNKKINILNL
jgi:transposase